MVGTTSDEWRVLERIRKTFGISNLAVLQLKIGTLPVKNDVNSHVTESRDIVRQNTAGGRTDRQIDRYHVITARF